MRALSKATAKPCSVRARVDPSQTTRATPANFRNQLMGLANRRIKKASIATKVESLSDKFARLNCFS
jgi:hypothetical protein